MACWLSWITPCHDIEVCKVRILYGRILQNNKNLPSLSESLPTSSESRVASLYEFHCLGSLEINEGIYFGTCQSILRTNYGLVVRHGLVVRRVDVQTIVSGSIPIQGILPI